MSDRTIPLLRCPARRACRPVLPAFSQLSPSESQKIVLKITNISIYMGTASAGTRFLAAQSTLSDGDTKEGLRKALPGLALALAPSPPDGAAAGDSGSGGEEWLQARKSVRGAHHARMAASTRAPPPLCWEFFCDGAVVPFE